MTSPSVPQSFHGLGIAPILLETLQRLRFEVPTPIQHKAIPAAIEGQDIMGIAQTGTGKTLAFGIPTVQRLAQTEGRQALVLVPTRELAIQVDDTLRKLASALGMRTAVVIGGAPMRPQIDALRRGPRIIIATPGRLVDHLEQRTLDLGLVGILIFDEADRMLDMGFAPMIDKIARRVPKDRQTLLFSATMPDQIVKVAASYMKLPLRVETARAGTAVEKIVQELFIVRKESKRDVLQTLLHEHRGSVLLFTRTKINAKKVTRAVRDMGHAAAEIHANRSLNQRREALEGFKRGKYRVLVATDIAARGIDVKGIELVINYDLPDDIENYVHRIGRTGRAGMEGKAISFATPDQEGDVRAIEKLTRLSLPISARADLPIAKFERGSGSQTHHRPQGRPQQRRHFGGQRRQGGGGGGGQGQGHQGQGQSRGGHGYSGGQNRHRSN